MKKQMTKTELAEKERRKKEKFYVDRSALTPDSFLTKEQCSTIAQVSVSTIKNWYLKRGLQFKKPSRQVKILYKDLIDFIERHTQVTQPIYFRNGKRNWRMMYDRMKCHIGKYHL